MLGSLKKNIMGMSMHKIIQQMGKIDPKNSTKIVTLEKMADHDIKLKALQTSTCIAQSGCKSNIVQMP
jgi:hypothetical protein